MDGAAVTPAQLVLADVHRDAVHPGAEVEVRGHPVQRADDVIEGLLDQVLGQRLVADVAHAHPSHAAVIAGEEDVERTRIAVEVGHDEGDVVDLFGGDHVCRSLRRSLFLNPAWLDHRAPFASSIATS